MNELADEWRGGDEVVGCRAVRSAPNNSGGSTARLLAAGSRVFDTENEVDERIVGGA
jgi:hypothetical protein